MPTFLPYTNNTPQAGQLISQTQQPILDNFTNINLILGGNATTDILNFTDNNAGMHSKLQFPVALGAAPATAAGKQTLYPRLFDNTVAPYGAFATNVNEVFFQNSANDADYPITASSIAASGFTFFPSGIIIQWGSGNIAADGQNFAFSHPFPTACLQVIISLVKSHGDTNVVSVVNGSVNAAGFNATSFTVGNAPAFQASLCSYIAIGY